MNKVSAQDPAFKKAWKRMKPFNFQTEREAYNLYYYINSLLPLDGAVAEFGVYQGYSAVFISNFIEGVPLYLFDTFTGIPKVNNATDIDLAGSFSNTSAAKVAIDLKDYPKLYIGAGLFSEVCQKNEFTDIKFCFVHMDVDLYSSTMEGLNFFYPRLTSGGILISHDYTNVCAPGVNLAFTEFFADKEENIVILKNTSQCLIRKV